MNLEMLLAATDGSSSGNEALRTATRIAQEAHGRLTVVTVARDPGQWMESQEVEQYRMTRPDLLGSTLMPRVRERLEPTIRGATGTPPPAHVLRLGIPSVEIPRVADTIHADLLVLGREHGVGRTIEGTVRRARVPCLIVPAGVDRFQRVLAAVADDPSSTEVLQVARRLAEVERGDVLAFHVEPPSHATDTGPQHDHAVRPVEVASAEQHGAWGAPTAVTAGVADWELVVRQGDAVAEILKAVRNERIDLVVVGCHRGESGHQSQAVASRLLRRSPCAVLTVPI